MLPSVFYWIAAGVGAWLVFSPSSPAQPGVPGGYPNTNPNTNPGSPGYLPPTPNPNPSIALTRADYQMQGAALGLSQAQIWDAWDLGLTPQEYAQGIPSYAPQYTGL